MAITPSAHGNPEEPVHMYAMLDVSALISQENVHTGYKIIHAACNHRVFAHHSLAPSYEAPSQTEQ